MVKRDALLRDLKRALQGGDLEQVASVRRTIAEAYPEEPEGAEALYKLGLDALFRGRDMDRAAELLRAAAKTKDPAWSPPARVSLGIVLMRQQKAQQAVFELRRVAGNKKQDLLSAQAWGLIVLAHREQNNQKEAERARQEQLKLLERLSKTAPEAEAALAHLTLGLERKHDGERAPARKHIEAALASGRLPKDEAAIARAALEDL